MTQAFSKRERLARTVDGRPVDRLPVALWRHFFLEERTAEGLVEAMLAWQREYDWDFLKINPRACYHVEDWGNRYEFSGDPHIKPALVRPVVHEVSDFRHLDRLDSSMLSAEHRASVLGAHLKAVADLRKALGPDVPMLMTVFTPMALAAELAGGPQDLAGLVAEDATMVHVGLRTITDTFAEFAARAVDAGADGIFLATTHVATETNFTREQYEEFGRPYDLEILEAVEHAPLNLLHVCRERSMVRDLVDYPVAMINWDTAADSNPDLAGLAPAAPDKALVGGLDRGLFNAASNRDALEGQIEAAREALGERPFVLGSTCTIDTTADPSLVRRVRDAVET